MLDVLVFAPHPDDAELGAGGAIVKAIDAGLKVGIIDLTAGEMGSLGTKDLRLIEAETARKVLGAELRQNLGFPDLVIPPGIVILGGFNSKSISPGSSFNKVEILIPDEQAMRNNALFIAFACVNIFFKSLHVGA